MMSNGKNTLVNLEMARNYDEDTRHISDLPDEVLMIILSFLTAREMVQICLLSRRWHNFWTSVPYLNFDCRDFTFPVRDGRFKRIDHVRFESFVNSLLLLRDNVTVHTFKLTSIILPFSIFCICYAVRHNLKNLEINIVTQFGFNDQLFHLPACLFTCESLEFLSILYQTAGPLEMIVPNNVFFPKLREVQFYRLKLKGNSIERFNSGCPVLESVKLKCCTLNMNDITFQTVKKLNMFYCKFISELDLSVFSISAPHLEYLKFRGNYPGAVKLREMFMVKKAKIVVLGDLLQFRQCEFLSSFSGIEDLEIHCRYHLKNALQQELQNCPTFHNLKNISLEMNCVLCDFDLLFSFKNHCPNLERVTIFRSENNCQGRHPNLDETARRFNCDVLWSHDDDADELVRLLVESMKRNYDVQDVVLMMSETAIHILFEN